MLKYTFLFRLQEAKHKAGACSGIYPDQSFSAVQHLASDSMTTHRMMLESGDLLSKTHFRPLAQTWIQKSIEFSSRRHVIED